jgi:hypothetical protein
MKSPSVTGILLSPQAGRFLSSAQLCWLVCISGFILPARKKANTQNNQKPTQNFSVSVFYVTLDNYKGYGMLWGDR